MANYGSLQPLIRWRERSLPIEWDREFERVAPLKVEIGFGNGDFLTRSAKEDPDCNYIGIEVTWGSTWRALRSSKALGLSNLRLFYEDARVALLWCFQERAVHGFTGLFPCPWPKRRHAEHRLFSPSFLRLCNSRLVDGGSLVVVTDDPDYRDQMLKEITVAATGMRSSLEIIPASFNTKYERKWQAGGRDEFYRLTFTKVEHHSVPFPETTLVKHHTIAHFDAETFAPQTQSEPYNVEFKTFVYDPVRKMAMQEAFTTEDAVEQHFWIRIRWTQEGWKISPAPGNTLLPVPSVQRALDLVREAAEGVVDSDLGGDVPEGDDSPD